ncbi:MAG: PD-(D/E)XK nuclease family protein [Holosporaceae bacterium]|jgi:RecB family exonuclease|nr:PD-(D/E)XK nuclease family protein [Holosporaceae bacterium]
MQYKIPGCSNFIERIVDILQNHPRVEYIFLPNANICNEIKKRLINKGDIILPKLISISDIIPFDSMKIVYILIGFLRSKYNDVPLYTLYKIAVSLSLFIKELILNNVDIGMIKAPSEFCKYLTYIEGLIHSSISVPEMKRILDLMQRKKELFLKSIKNKCIATICIDDNYWKPLLGIANENGIAIFCDGCNEDFPDNTIELMEFSSQFDEGFGIALIIKKAILEQKTVLVVSSDADLNLIVKSELNYLIADDFCSMKNTLLEFLVINMLEKQYECCSVIKVIKQINFQMGLRIESFFRNLRTVPKNFFDAFNLYLKKDSQFMEIIDTMHSISLESSGGKSFSEWMAIYRNLLSLLGTTNTLDLTNIDTKKVSLEEFCVFLKNLISQKSETIAPNVTFLTPMNACFLEPDLVIIADAKEKSLSSTENNCWIPEFLLKNFGMKSTVDENKLLRQAFDFLVRKKHVIITESSLIKREKLQRYKYLSKLIIDLGVKKTNWINDVIKNVRKSYKPEIIKFEKPVVPINVCPKNFWVSDLEMLIRNPYAFYAKKILKLSEANRINEPNRGDYIHKVLEKFIKTAKDKTNIKELKRISKEVLENAWIQPSYFGIWYFRLDKILSFAVRNIQNVSKCYAEVSGDFSIKLSETCEVKISCRVDRVDVDTDGNISIVDYKTGQVPTRSQIFSGQSVQLPIASIVASKGGFLLEKTTVRELSFWKLGSHNGGKIISISRNEDEIQLLNDTTEKMLEKLVTQNCYDVIVSSVYDNPYVHLSRIKELNYA